MAFRGFHREALRLLRVLPGMDAQGYAERRVLLEEGLIQPGKELVTLLAPRLEVKPVGMPKHAVSPLHTDLRFAKAGSPRYKEHLLLSMHHGPDRRSGVVMWIPIVHDEASFSCGMQFSAQGRERWRQAIAGEQGRELVDAMIALEAKHREHRFEIQGELLKRPPAPWDETHPRAAYLRRTSFQVRFTEALPEELIDQPELFDWFAERVDDLAPIYRWLVRHMGFGRMPTLP